MKANTFGVVTCLWDKLMKLLKEKTKGIQEVTWQELKDLRDGNNLVKGRLYRITDYQCTTIQENTKSAGHQFDIVLLALSENKLAEEGWAMEHPTDVWTVDFYDGDEGHYYYQCYVYATSEGVYNVVDIHTLLGMSDVDDYNDINVDNKTMTLEYKYEDQMIKENLTYNYFQNSNLSAWKVWYCLDNDKSRFAWVSDKSYLIYAGEFFERKPQGDEQGYYAWEKGINVFYTQSLTPQKDDTIFAKQGNEFIEDDIADGYVPKGTGVIYRLIDEFNNDIPYDFKNILIYNETYRQYCYATIDVFNNINEDPTLDGTRVKAIHVLCDNNDVLKPIAKGGFKNNPLVNIIFLNNNTLADEYSNCVVSNGLPIVN